MSSRKERIRTQVTALLGSGGPALTLRQIAETVGCSTKTIQRIQREIQPAMEEIEEKLAEYRRLLRKELPLDYRARRLKELAAQDSQLMVALKAIERADILDGFARLPEPEQVPPCAPLFSLPPGSTIAVRVDEVGPPPKTQAHS